MDPSGVKCTDLYFSLSEVIYNVAQYVPQNCDGTSCLGVLVSAT
jgi:hypothetical protein